MTDISMTRGTTRRLRHEFWLPRPTPASPRLPYPIAASGAVLVLTVKRDYSDAVPLFAKTIGAGIEIPGEPANVAVSTITPDDTDDLDAPSLLVWDLELRTASSEVYQADGGKLYLRPDATR